MRTLLEMTETRHDINPNNNDIKKLRQTVFFFSSALFGGCIILLLLLLLLFVSSRFRTKQKSSYVLSGPSFRYLYLPRPFEADILLI